MERKLQASRQGQLDGLMARFARDSATGLLTGTFKAWAEDAVAEALRKKTRLSAAQQEKVRTDALVEYAANQRVRSKEGKDKQNKLLGTRLG